MKIHNPTVFLKDGELFCLTVEVPEEPKQKINCAGTHACTCASLAFKNRANRDVVDAYDDNCPHRYKSAITSAKSSAVKVKNREEVEKFIYTKLCDDSEGKVKVLEFEVWRKGLFPDHPYNDLSTLTGYEAEVLVFETTTTLEKFATITSIHKHNCDYRKAECTNEGKMIEGVWVCSNHHKSEEEKTPLLVAYYKMKNDLSVANKRISDLEKENAGHVLYIEEANERIIELEKANRELTEVLKKVRDFDEDSE